jgi:hypothetical protein
MRTIIAATYTQTSAKATPRIVEIRAKDMAALIFLK